MANAILQIRIVDRIKDVDRLPHPLPEAWLDKTVMPLQKDGTGTSSARRKKEMCEPMLEIPQPSAATGTQASQDS